MAEFFSDYGLFLLKTITLVVAFAAVVMIVVAAAAKRGKNNGELDMQLLNERFADMETALQQVVLSKSEFKQRQKNQKQQAKAASKTAEKNRLFVLDFKGDVKATEVASLREEITAILLIAKTGDEVLLRLENAGGLVHEHGLAASQLQRLKARQIPLTVAVDKVAASGGYLMACLADKIVAAPFAVLGSIGVLAQIPNFYRLLDEHGIEFEQIKAGELKRTLTVFGKNTDADRQRMQEQVEDTHRLFKDFVSEHRPIVDMTAVGTGEHWHGLRALQLKLVDLLQTSDDYLLAAKDQLDIYQLAYKTKKDLGEKLAAVMQTSLHSSLLSLLQHLPFFRR